MKQIWAGHRPSVPVKHAVLLNPVHAEVASERKEHTDGLQRHEVAGEHEEIDQVDVLDAHFELGSKVQSAVVTLGLGEFAVCIEGELLALDLTHRMNLSMM